MNHHSPYPTFFVVVDHELNVAGFINDRSAKHFAGLQSSEPFYIIIHGGIDAPIAFR
jgi:hypothetical protein